MSRAVCVTEPNSRLDTRLRTGAPRPGRGVRGESPALRGENAQPEPASGLLPSLALNMVVLPALYWLFGEREIRVGIGDEVI